MPGIYSCIHGHRAVPTHKIGIINFDENYDIINEIIKDMSPNFKRLAGEDGIDMSYILEIYGAIEPYMLDIPNNISNIGGGVVFHSNTINKFIRCLVWDNAIEMALIDGYKTVVEEE